MVRSKFFFAFARHLHPSLSKTASSSHPQASSPLKKAPTFTKHVAEVVEVEDDVRDERHASATASPEPAQIFSDDEESDPDYHTDAEDWPELPPRKGDETEPPQWREDQCYENFTREFNHWRATGEILMD